VVNRHTASTMTDWTSGRNSRVGVRTASGTSCELTVLEKDLADLDADRHEEANDED
jgi:hypothetical protein